MIYKKGTLKNAKKSTKNTCDEDVFCDIFHDSCSIEYLQRRIQNPVEHLRWSFFVKIGNGIQWNLSKADTYGTEVFVCFREVSALERFELKSFQI